MRIYTQSDFNLIFIKEVEGRKRKSSPQVDRCGLFKCTECDSPKVLVFSSALKSSGKCNTCTKVRGRTVVVHLTQEYLKKLYTYNPTTGIFTNIKYPNKTVGTVHNGYITISIGYKRYQAQRLAWLYMYGVLPTNVIDHKNHDPSDNSLSNLRDVTKLVNMQSKKLYKCNKSGFHGVIWDVKTNKWRARIGIEGKTLNLGSFSNKSDAIAARKAAEVKHNFHSNHGSI